MRNLYDLNNIMNLLEKKESINTKNIYLLNFSNPKKILIILLKALKNDKKFGENVLLIIDYILKKKNELSKLIKKNLYRIVKIIKSTKNKYLYELFFRIFENWKEQKIIGKKFLKMTFNIIFNEKKYGFQKIRKNIDELNKNCENLYYSRVKILNFKKNIEIVFEESKTKFLEKKERYSKLKKDILILEEFRNILMKKFRDFKIINN